MMPPPLLDQDFLERLERLTLHWQKSFPGLVGGHNLSRFPGPGLDFLDHRSFHEGDDLRSVNWRAYLRLDKLFLKMFQVEPRVPVRLLLDVSPSMTVGSPPGHPLKFDYARRLAAAITYVGLVRLDSLVLQPFADRLLEPCHSGGGRHRFRSADLFLRALQPARHSDFLQVVKTYVTTYQQRGLTIVISDFLDPNDVQKPLKFLADFGHELLLVHLWGEEDESPSGAGEVEVQESETGLRQTVFLSDELRAQHAANFHAFCEQLRALALRNGGRYFGSPTSAPLEAVIFGSLLGSRGAA